MKRSFLLLFLLFLCAQSLMADNFKTPTHLEELSSSSIYSVGQDKNGAIWLNTNKGLCRFNGNSVEWLSRPMLGIGAVYDGNTGIYAATSRYVSRYDITDRNPVNIVVTSDRLDDSVLESCEDSLFVAISNKIYLETRDSSFLYCSLPDSCAITSLLHTPNSAILAGTESDGLYLMDKNGISLLLDTSDAIFALYYDRTGNLWIGFGTSGIASMNPQNGKLLQSVTSYNGIRFKSVRSISSDSLSNVYFATVKGLFKLDPSGMVTELTIENTRGYPFRCVFVDRDDNVWAGSYYSGVYYSNNYTYPFTDLPFDPSVRLSRGIVQDRTGTLWLFTDNFGAYRSRDGAQSWRLVPGTQEIKYQGAYYDADMNAIWTSEYQGDVLCYSLPSMSCKRYPIDSKDNPLEYVGPITKQGEVLYLGGINGVYLLNPSRERKVTRRLSGLSSRVYDLEFAPDGKLWIASTGLFHWTEGGEISQYKPELFSVLVPDIAFDGSGRLWAACVNRGLCLVDDDSELFLSKANTGLSDNHMSFVEPLGGTRLLAGTSNGISIVDYVQKIAYNYNKSNGLGLSSGRWVCTCRLPDGSVLVGGSGGIEKMNPADFNPGGQMPAPVVDRLDVNGKMYMCDLSSDKVIDLSYMESNFSFVITSFDYSKVAAVTFHYKLDGYDEDWLPLGPTSSVSYMNMSPGRYTFQVRAQRGGFPDSFDSVRLVVHPVWYATLAAKAGFLILALVLAGILLYILYTGTILSERLALRERESEEKTKFFVDLSYQLRTPLNLIIGQLETFFKNFGARTAGIADIEDVYGKAKRMRSLISEYVDSQNDGLEQAAAVRNSKFLNAAIGAVERNLYTGKLDIPVLCRELNVGKTTLTARLREVCGMTPRAFIEDIRLKNAAGMLLDGNMRVSEVSDRLGFSSPRYFSKCFKAKFGCIPSEYKG